MTNQTDWSFLFLKGDPFGITPPVDPENIVWAGMVKLKKRFDEIFQESVSSSATQVVLNRGPYGGGKTHASLYFGIEENLPLVATTGVRIHSISIRLPKEIGNPAQDFYTDFLDTLGMTRVREIIHDAISNLSKEDALQSLQKILRSEELARAFWLLGTEDVSEKQALLRTYFFEGCTRTDLKKLEIARNITKAQDRFRIVAGILQCLIGFDANLAPSQHSRVCLWIDEVEDLVYFTSAQFRTLSEGIREIVDRLPNFFTLFLNMTLAEPDEHEELKVLLGNAVLDRITDVIYFSELNINEALQYVNKLINHEKYRIQSPQLKDLPQTYPFEEIALRMLLEGLKKKTPRDINKRCRNIINCAFRDDRFSQAGKGIIDPSYVMQIEKSELDREID